MKKVFAFTLAEVLIVISLLGVIAALTLPNLYYEKTKHEYSTRIKYFYSKMDNAISEMEIEKGSFRDMKKPADKRAAYSWYMENIDHYMGHTMVKSPTESSNDWTIFYQDGSSLKNSYVGGCLDMLYDVNGKKGPNRLGNDEFMFLFCFGNGATYFGSDNIFWGTYGDGLRDSSTTRDDIIDKCKENQAYCSRLLEYDGWQFMEDYPHF